MATKYYYKCVQCKKAYKPKKKGMFEVLWEAAKGSKEKCEVHSKDCALIFEFELGVGATSPKATLLDCFLPEELEHWKNGEDKVTFYPFLVVFERHGREEAIWLPYWHIVESKAGQVKKKYGQWAPFMDKKLFESLCGQAGEKGYLKKSL